MDKIQLRSLEKKLNYRFNNKQLLINAILFSRNSLKAAVEKNCIQVIASPDLSGWQSVLLTCAN